MNRKELIAFLKAHGYTGDLKVEAIKKWLADEGGESDNIKIKQKGGGYLTVNVDEAWGKAATFDEAENAAGGDDEESAGNLADLKARIKSMETKLRLARAAGGTSAIDAEDEQREQRPVNAKQFAMLAARKAYDRKANRGETVFPDGDVAEACGAHMRLKLNDTILKRPDYAERKDDLGILGKVHVEYDNTLGGAFVPIEFSNYLVSLKELYDDPRADFRSVPMARDKQVFDKDTGDLTVYGVAEGAAITASTGGTANVELTANKLGILCTASNELLNDSAIPIAEWIGRKMAYSFGKAEQQAFWVGDGTATYYDFQGITSALLALHATRANIAGAIVGTGDTFAALTIGDFEKVAGRLPDFDGVAGTDPAWYMNKRFYFEVCVRLALAVGGVTASEVEGKRTPMFLGYPVKFRRSFIRSGGTTEARDQFAAILGWPSLAGTIGDVRGGISIAQSDQYLFNQDLIAFRGIKRVAFKAHDVGNASATESLRNPGPVVGLLMAAS